VENPELDTIEASWVNCSSFDRCYYASTERAGLSNIPARDPARGSRNPLVVLVTSAPDAKSARDGVSYSGPSDRRIGEFLQRPGYGIELEPGADAPSNVGDYLSRNRIYRTSAVKCSVAGADDGGGNAVIFECRRRNLDAQIAAMPNVALIIPMGGVAIRSILGLQAAPKVLSYVGSSRGMINYMDRYKAGVVCLPHPSPGNPSFNMPPQSVEFEAFPSFDGLQAMPGNSGTMAARRGFRTALSRIRHILDGLGYA
jgi:hypothetical protein